MMLYITDSIAITAILRYSPILQLTVLALANWRCRSYMSLIITCPSLAWQAWKCSINTSYTLRSPSVSTHGRSFVMCMKSPFGFRYMMRVLSSNGRIINIEHLSNLRIVMIVAPVTLSVVPEVVTKLGMAITEVRNKYGRIIISSNT